MDWFFDKAKEPSTINGLFVLAGIAGLQIDPQTQHTALTVLGVAASIYNIVRKEK